MSSIGLRSRRGAAARLRRHEGLGARDRSVPGLAAVHLGALDGGLAAQDGGRPEQRLLEEVGAVEDRVGEPEVVRRPAAEGPALVERVLEDQRDGLVGTEQVGHQPGTAPARYEPEHDLGQAESRGRVHHGAVGAVQRHLEPAPEGEAVDEAERRLATLAELAEDGVAELGDDAYGVGTATLDRGEVGAGRQDERLAGDRDGVDGVVGERLVDRGVEREQRAGTERVGLGVVLAVVERDQAERRAGQRDLAQVGLGDPLGVGADRRGTLEERGDVGGAHLLSPFESVGPVQWGFSQITVPPMPMPMHMVVRP